MEYLTDIDEFQAAMAQVDFSIDLNQKNSSGFLLENRQLECYNKAQIILDVPEMIRCHKTILNMNFMDGELTESDMSMVEKLYKLGEDRGFIAEHNFEDVEEGQEVFDEDTQMWRDEVVDIGDGTQMYNEDLEDVYMEEGGDGSYGSIEDALREVMGTDLYGDDSMEALEERDEFDDVMPGEVAGNPEDELEGAPEGAPEGAAPVDGEDETEPSDDDMPFEADDEQAGGEEPVEAPAEDPADAPVDAPAPDQEMPSEEPPAEEPPAEDAPADETPAEEAPVEEPPADGNPEDEVPADDGQGEVPPEGDDAAAEQPEDAEGGESPAEEGPVDVDTTNGSEEEPADDEEDEIVKLTGEEKKDRQNKYKDLWRKTLRDLGLTTPIGEVTDPKTIAAFWDQIATWDMEDPAAFLSNAEMKKLEDDEKIEDVGPEDDKKDNGDDSPADGEEEDPATDDVQDEGSDEKPEDGDDKSEDDDDKAEDSDDSEDDESEEDSESDSEEESDDDSEQDA